MVSSSGGPSKQLTSFAAGVSEAVLDGLGTAVLAVSGSRLLRIDPQSGDLRELIGTTPRCSAGFPSLIPGSILPINVSFVTEATQVAPIPLPTSLAGVRVLMDGTPLPILSISPSAVWFQVPFELTPGPTVSVGVEHTSLFEGCAPTQVAIKQRQPFLVIDSFNRLVLSHQDFQGLVTAASPVQPGEVIRAYALGLGAVAPAMQTGVPTPSGQLFNVSEPFSCGVGPGLGSQPLDVLFAGLAPGGIGIYQIDVRMPSPLPAQEFLLNCGTPDNVSERAVGFVPGP